MSWDNLENKVQLFLGEVSDALFFWGIALAVLGFLIFRFGPRGWKVWDMVGSVELGLVVFSVGLFLFVLGGGQCRA